MEEYASFEEIIISCLALSDPFPAHLVFGFLRAPW